jgi:hypothetical protein
MLALYDSNFTVCDYLEKRAFNESFYDDQLLVRAKHGLDSLTFFGLAEHHELSWALFAKMVSGAEVATEDRQIYLNLRSKKLQDSLFKRTEFEECSWSMQEKIRDVNRLDLELYEYARELFFHRIKHFGLNAEKY